ncbi:MAG: hypothetical protein JO099_02830, partial [Acidobacteriia bacterium]|nr:hypothetical protein [Terriglobia bacterium]
MVRNAVRQGLKLRAQAQVRVRQPLPALYVISSDSVRPAYREQSAVIQSELNVKQVKFAERRDAFFRRTVKVDWKTANVTLRRDSGRFRAAFDALDDSARDALVAQIEASGNVEVPGFDQPVPANLFRLEETPDPRYGISEEGGLFALDLTVSDALKREGLVRDL